jgi:hypothetical protein
MLRTRLTAMYPLHLDAEGDASGGAAVITPAPAPVSNDSQPGLRSEHEDSALARTFRELRAAATRGEVAMEGQVAPTAPVATLEIPQPSAEPATDPVPDAAPDPAQDATAVEDAGDTEAVTEGGEPAPALTVELPARRGQEPIQIAVEDQATADALRNMRNLAARTEQAEARAREARQQQAEYEAFESHLRLDPIGFVVDQMDPNYRVHVAEQLLAQDGVLEAVLERLDRWQGNPDARVADQARFEAARLRNAQTVQRQQSAAAAQRTIVENITTNVDALAELVPAELAAQFRDDALGDMAAFARANRLRGPLAPEQFPELLARRLKLYGVDAARATAALTHAGSTPQSPMRARPKGPAATALAANKAAQGAKATGSTLVTAKRIRQNAAAAVPGAGAAITVPTQSRPEKGSGVKGAIEFLRRQLPGATR